MALLPCWAPLLGLLTNEVHLLLRVWARLFFSPLFPLMVTRLILLCHCPSGAEAFLYSNLPEHLSLGSLGLPQVLSLLCSFISLTFTSCPGLFPSGKERLLSSFHFSIASIGASAGTYPILEKSIFVRLFLNKRFMYFCICELCRLIRVCWGYVQLRAGTRGARREHQILWSLGYRRLWGAWCRWRKLTLVALP